MRDSMPMVLIGRRIRKLRREKNMNQAALAKQVGVSTQAVSGWEGGLNNITLLHAAKLVKVLGTTLDELLEGITDA